MKRTLTTLAAAIAFTAPTHAERQIFTTPQIDPIKLERCIKETFWPLVLKDATNPALQKESCETQQITEWAARDWQAFQKNTDPVTGKWVGSDRTFGAFYLRRRYAVALAMNQPITTGEQTKDREFPKYDALAKCEHTYGDGAGLPADFVKTCLGWEARSEASVAAGWDDVPENARKVCVAESYTNGINWQSYDWLTYCLARERDKASK